MTYIETYIGNKGNNFNFKERVYKNTQNFSGSKAYFSVEFTTGFYKHCLILLSPFHFFLDFA